MANTCPGCHRKVYHNEEIVFHNEHWHRTCFKCTSCKARLRPGKFLEHQGQAYCEPCHNSLFGQKGYGKSFTPRSSTAVKPSHTCKACNKEITEKEIRVGTFYYHPECFVCKSCGEQLPKNNYITSGSDNYCTRCAPLESLSIDPKIIRSLPQCSKCGESIDEEVLLFVNYKYYHSSCFTCEKCSKELYSVDFTLKGGKFYCANCI
ncbi:lim domain family [Anaeramoeba ignava]|uniref:Lim domain family n=1 Tax=Anaeramoeba ignava TaxID=1746090 RepID=A0A9Q0LH16_ANAIG|nr:lim domain family [Anaeramoeba ignava]|eukprot:Anaeramoba_ignava/a94641_40.p1 GENE.a94641_40~~a94641_40.p1  ORF type:complete len:206 (+),score=11.09 a94641_40:80-697(+)